MLSEGMKKKGHTVQIWAPKKRFNRFSPNPKLKKWLGYIDQFLIFPVEIKRRLKHCSKNTIFVFTDQALGPWIPVLKNYPHAIHCHDFLAQQSALGEMPENIISWTGRRYQRYIRRGYSTGKNFISVSHKTRNDLHGMLGFVPQRSEVVYNGVDRLFSNTSCSENNSLSKKTGIDLSKGYILHVGGNTWYKNRVGVIEIYSAWRLFSKLDLPLLMIGDKPSGNLSDAFNHSFFKKDIHFIVRIEDKYLRQAYAGASVFIFPSLAEGFGWPIAEAMASGCPVITTNEVPMTEVLGDAGFRINRRPQNTEAANEWALDSAKIVEHVLALSAEDRNKEIKKGFLNAKRFDADKALDKIEEIYKSILQSN